MRDHDGSRGIVTDHEGLWRTSKDECQDRALSNKNIQIGIFALWKTTKWYIYWKDSQHIDGLEHDVRYRAWEPVVKLSGGWSSLRQLSHQIIYAPNHLWFLGWEWSDREFIRQTKAIEEGTSQDKSSKWKSSFTKCIFLFKLFRSDFRLKLPGVIWGEYTNCC